MTSETTKKRSRLFAKLMVEEYEARTTLIQPNYLLFLKAQRNTRNPWCPYGRAVKSIQG